uniref:HTH CENPB-type domain-containing protein n=1 Tax=Sphaeramia orbicularis TaxID=375764 RepID=A0A672Y3I8_9TELE
ITYAHEEMEKRLLQWIKEKQQAGGALTETIICEKARMLYVELLKQNPGPSADETPAEEFKASRGWLDNFKKRTGYAACNCNFLSDCIFCFLL